MTVGRLEHIHLVLLLGISLLIPLLMAYSVYVDLSETVLLSSDMSFEDPEDEDLSTCQNEFIFMPMLSSNLFPGTHFGREPSPFSSLLTSSSQMTPLLRC